LPRVAFYTFGILHETLGHTRVQEFADRTPHVFASAARRDGFIGRSTNDEPWGNFWDVPRFYDPALHPPQFSTPKTLTLWRDLVSVYEFSYAGLHLEALQKRKEWFMAPKWPTYVAWWVGDDELPTWGDAARRLELLHDRGPTPEAFTFKQPFDSEGNPTVLNLTAANL
jgi:hypothetical protein